MSLRLQSHITMCIDVILSHLSNTLVYDAQQVFNNVGRKSKFAMQMQFYHSVGFVKKCPGN